MTVEVVIVEALAVKVVTLAAKLVMKTAHEQSFAITDP